MVQLISQQGRMSVAELSDNLSVTTETVRRDLSALERMGLIRRVHGGAVPASALASIESGISERDQANTEAKDAIAAAAIALLPPPGSMIVIDAGSTTARFAALLPRDHGLTVVTHAVPIAARLAGLPHIDLVLLPGRVRPTTHAAVGVDTVLALSDVRADVSFVATNGLSIAHGLTTPDRDEAATKRAIVAAGRRTVVLADSTKIGVESSLRFAALSDIDVLITDSGVSDEDASALAAADVEVVIA
ncbi:DeoR/GlpR family DNA-binding transcription regulator [Nocardioides sp.]|uniref:DeoR/GlpR family DNA-binding transcription regulator n=1 Tax=Nocardioides sp. TaxID=35761 RepID=UPI002D7FF76C|nr:DeoR/GlpR family DNA-binding transcription regulator [Nocardioides sp.]